MQKKSFNYKFCVIKLCSSCKKTLKKYASEITCKNVATFARKNVPIWAKGSLSSYRAGLYLQLILYSFELDKNLREDKF